MDWQDWDKEGYDAEHAEKLTNLGFVDSTWGNDMCPSFSHDTLNLRVWIDFIDPDEREGGPETMRYAVCELDPDGHSVDQREYDDFQPVLDYVAEIKEEYLK